MSHATRIDLQRFIDSLCVGVNFGEEEAEAILELPGQFAEAKANQELGTSAVSEHALLVVNGLVGRFGHTSGGTRQMTAIHLPGDMINPCAFAETDATRVLQALCQTTLLRIPHWSIHSLISKMPAIAEAFWRNSMAEASILAQWVINVGRRNARERLAHLFCEMAVRMRAIMRNNRTSYPWDLTQMQIADAVSLTPVHVNRVLRTLRDDNLANVARREVEILDWKGLMIEGDFDASYLASGARRVPQPWQIAA